MAGCETLSDQEPDTCGCCVKTSVGLAGGRAQGGARLQDNLWGDGYFDVASLGNLIFERESEGVDVGLCIVGGNTRYYSAHGSDCTGQRSIASR